MIDLEAVVCPTCQAAGEVHYWPVEFFKYDDQWAARCVWGHTFNPASAAPEPVTPSPRETAETLSVREIRTALEGIGWDGERIEVFGAGTDANRGVGGWLETPIGRVVLVAAIERTTS